MPETLVIIGSGNPVWQHAITWTNADMLSIGPCEMNFSFIQENAF